MAYLELTELDLKDSAYWLWLLINFTSVFSKPGSWPQEEHLIKASANTHDHADGKNGRHTVLHQILRSNTCVS